MNISIADCIGLIQLKSILGKEVQYIHHRIKFHYHSVLVADGNLPIGKGSVGLTQIQFKGGTLFKDCENPLNPNKLKARQKKRMVFLMDMFLVN
jgi:hypothetical protein